MNKSTLLEETLLHELAKGHYRPGDAIPSRNSLTARYKCSRTTVGHAISALKRRGILVSNQGGQTRVAECSGTCVRTTDVYLIAHGLEVYSEQAIREMFLPGLENEVAIHTLSDDSLGGILTC